MPRRAARVCQVPGCNSLASSGLLCEAHGVARGQRRDDRLSAAKRGYDHRWRKVRQMVLARRPLCSDPFKVHEQNNEVVLAMDVHHIIPLNSNRPLRELNSFDNLMPLCHSCHSRITSGGSRPNGEGGGDESL